MDDEAIIELYNSRDEEAVSETQRKYVGEDADECVNDALHAAWTAIPPERPRSLKTYLGRLTRNISVSRYRREHAQKRGGAEVLLSELDDCVPERVSLDELVERRRLSELISAWLDTLTASAAARPNSSRSACSASGGG